MTTSLAPFVQTLMLAIAMLTLVFVGAWTHRIELRPRRRAKPRRLRRRQHPHGGGAA
jgi:hypothetical protein